MLCQDCVTDFKRSLHVLAKYCKLLKNRNIVKNIKNRLKTRDLAVITCPRRSGRVVEGAPLLRELKGCDKPLFSLVFPKIQNVAVSELRQNRLF